MESFNLPSTQCNKLSRIVTIVRSLHKHKRHIPSSLYLHNTSSLPETERLHLPLRASPSCITPTRDVNLLPWITIKYYIQCYLRLVLPYYSYICMYLSLIDRGLYMTGPGKSYEVRKGLGTGGSAGWSRRFF
jgi:hypothetical protein